MDESQLLDFDLWRAMFPLSRLRNEPDWVDEGQHVTSPFHLAVVEQLREEVAASAEKKSLGRAVPTDVFVSGKGEPKRRDITKIGGLPYRAASESWPAAEDGTPFTFVAQFRFVESLDIAGALPGDVMLFFARDESPFSREPETFRIEWQRLGIKRLVPRTKVPKPAWTFVTAFGVRHRTLDFPAAEKSFSRYQREWLIPIIEGTKIGGCPRWVQKAPKQISGRFLCSLGSIKPEYKRPYPWVNQRAPIPIALDEDHPERELLWDDMGSFYFFIDDKCQVSWHMQSY